MNTVVVRNGRTNRAIRRRRRTRRVQPTVVVQANRPTQSGRRRRRRRPRRVRNSGGRSGGGKGETFVFSKDSIAGNSKGSIVFGPSLSDCVAFSDGILKAYHEYKITMVRVQFQSEAASTASGSISYELDPHCKYSELKSTINKFGITKGGSVTFRAQKINGEKWIDTAEDQFKLHYKGNGANTIAGSFRVTIMVQVQNPK